MKMVNPFATIYILLTVAPIVGIIWAIYYLAMQFILPYFFIHKAPVFITSLVWMAVPLYFGLPWWYNLLFLQHLIRLNGYWNSFNEIWNKRKELNGRL